MNGLFKIKIILKKDSKNLRIRLSIKFIDNIINNIFYNSVFAFIGTIGKIKWTDNWILYLDGLFQFLYLQSSDNQNLCTLSEINSIQVNVTKHEEFVKHKKGRLFSHF